MKQIKNNMNFSLPDDILATEEIAMNASYWGYYCGWSSAR